ncbi:MAG TPA: response regulator, partial [Pyrinomonadaceae bacterium]
GARAIEKLEEISPDIVLVDIFMPGMNGYQVCEHIKRDERFRHIPVMLLVGSFEPFDEAEARRVGADDYLSKPFQSIRQLVNKVGALLGRADSEEETPTRELTLPSAVTPSPPPAPPAVEMSAEELERSTANTAPLPRAWQGASQEAVAEAVAAEPQPEQRHEEPQQEQKIEDGARPATSLREDSLREASQEVSLEDSTQEDEMIESAPLEEFSGPFEEKEDAAPPPEASTLAADFNEPEMESPREAPVYDPKQETLSSFSAPEKSAVAVASATASTAGGASRMGTSMGRVTALSDDTLLDLDDMLPGRRVEEADDFILDLQDEAFAMDAGTLEQYEEELQEAQPATEEFVEAQRAVEEQRADFALVEEPQVQETALAQAEVPITAAEAQPSAPEISSTVQPQASTTGQITLSQLSPEVIDAIARRAVEQISERVIEEVAWEVVPQLAELIIKRHLERERTQTQ